MSVIKAKRNESHLEALDQTDRLAAELTKLMIRNFGIKDLNHVARRAYAFGRDDQEDVGKYIFLISDFKKSINQDVRLIGYHIKAADEIWPTTLSECDRRRDFQNLALGNCAHIRHELQRFCHIFDVSIDNYRMPIYELNKTEHDIKRWRQRDNRFRNKIIRGNA